MSATSVRKLPAVVEYRAALMRLLPLVATDLAGEASRHGLSLRVSEPRQGDTITYHWMFDDLKSGVRVLDYWPLTGTWRDPRCGEMGCVGSPVDAFLLAGKRRGKVPIRDHVLIGERVN